LDTTSPSRARLPSLSMAPPLASPVLEETRPLVMVSPEMVALTPALMTKIWWPVPPGTLSPLMLRAAAPGPWMVTLLATVRGPLGVLVPLTPWANTMVSPELAAATTAASEPAPLARVFVTISTAGTQRSSRLSTWGRVRAGRRRVAGWDLDFSKRWNQERVMTG